MPCCYFVDVCFLFTACLLCCYCVVTVLLLCCYCVVTVYVLSCYCVVTVLLLYIYCHVTVLLLWCYCVVTVYLLDIMSLFCYCRVTLLLFCCYCRVTGYCVATVLLLHYYCIHTAMLLHCYWIVISIFPIYGFLFPLISISSIFPSFSLISNIPTLYLHSMTSYYSHLFSTFNLYPVGSCCLRNHFHYLHVYTLINLIKLTSLPSRHFCLCVTYDT
jgi:hypothetical protein